MTTRKTPVLIVILALFLASFKALANPIIIPAPPQVAAKAYLLMDAATGEVLVGHNVSERLPPASLTKMMTSYIVKDEIDRGELAPDDKIPISDNAWRKGGSKSGSSTMFLDPRTEVSVMDLLRGVVVQSGNDASIALAEHLAGSEDAFADVMNQYAQLLGMHNTNFVNATGWPAQEQYSTAEDLAVLARAVIYDQPDHYPLYAEKYFSYNGINQPNRNRLLFRDSTVDGLKTGHTNAAGYGLVASAERQNMRLIAVVLGTDSENARAVEAQKLLAYGFRYYQTHQLYSKGEELSRNKVWKGKLEEVSMGLDSDAVITIPRGGKDQLKAEVSIDSFIQAPIEPGRVLGELTVTLLDDQVYRADLVALGEVEQAGFFARLWDSLVMRIKSLFS